MIMKTGSEFIADRTQSGRNRYKLKENGKEISLTGVTTILNEQAKPYLINWAASEAYKDALTKSKTQIEEVLKTKNYAHTIKSDVAKDTGTDAHTLVESFINHYIQTKEYKIFEDKDNAEANISAVRFMNWAIENKVEFTQSEISVYHGLYNYAGSFDFICKIDGKFYLGDYKTSKQIDNTYYAQAAAYAYAVNYMQELQGEEKIDFTGAIIVKSTKSKDDVVFFEKVYNGFKKVTIPAFEVSSSTQVDRHFLYFLGLLCAYRYNKGAEVEFFKRYALEGILTEKELLDLLP